MDQMVRGDCRNLTRTYGPDRRSLGLIHKPFYLQTEENRLPGRYVASSGVEGGLPWVVWGSGKSAAWATASPKAASSPDCPHYSPTQRRLWTSHLLLHLLVFFVLGFIKLRAIGFLTCCHQVRVVTVNISFQTVVWKLISKGKFKLLSISACFHLSPHVSCY